MSLNLLGSKYGRLTVIAKTALRSQKSVVWHCVCRCGNKNALIPSRDLIHNPRKGCGVCHDTKHPLYGIWRGIISRCTDPKSSAWPHYGGRGIKVCPRWTEDFLNFVEDMGPRPSEDYSIDRIDVNGHYEPTNCRWADFDTQARNKREATYGLSDEAILKIYTSKDSQEFLALEFNVSIKTVQNIQCRNYSPRATDICVKYMLGIKT